MSERPRVTYDPNQPGADSIRLWLLQLGAEPFRRAEAGASGLPQAPQHPGVTRAEVAAFVHQIKGVPTRETRFDDHGSAMNWPRGSF